MLQKSEFKPAHHIQAQVKLMRNKELDPSSKFLHNKKL